MSLSVPTLKLLAELLDGVTVSARQPNLVEAATVIVRAREELAAEMAEAERRAEPATNGKVAEPVG